ncbi:MAG: hypothetical protein ABIJ26_07595 [Candidatus Margulisiibacteriota bacterium]
MLLLVILKIIVLIAGLVALATGLSMLLFFERFVKFNKYFNQRFFVKRYDTSVFNVDSFVFAKHYIMAIVFLGLGAFLISIFLKYSAY